MLRPRSLRPALTGHRATRRVLGALLPAVALLAGHVPPSAAAAAPPDEDSPLVVSIDSLSPSVVPASGPVTVTGSVTNRDDQPWSTINLYPFLGSAPITTGEELAAAAETPAAEYVGARVVDVGDTVEELAPGESAPFSIRLPRGRMPVDGAGVYWFGVHALGQGPDGRDTIADGRARTFLPHVPRSNRRQVEVALVVPLRRSLTREPDGSLADVGGWARTLGPDGALRRLVDLGAAAGDRAVTWLIDPALVEAAQRLAQGNPPRSLAPTDAAGPIDPGDSASPSGTPTAGEDPTSGGPGSEPEEGTGSEPPAEDPGTEDGAPPAHEPSAQEQEAAEEARAWLARLSEAVESDEVLVLPYGDVDVAAAVAEEPDLLERARDRSEEVTSAWGVPTTAAVGSPTGFLDPDAVPAVDPASVLLVTDRMFDGEAPAVAVADEQRLVVTASGAASGGPGPDEPRATVALRQRILAEAVVRLLEPGRRPLVAQLPAGWAPESVSGFWEGMDQDWVELTTVDDAAERRGTRTDLDTLTLPRWQERRRLEPAAVDAAEELVAVGEVLQHVLRDNSTVATEVADEALASLSYSARAQPLRARTAAGASTRWIEQRLGSVTIEGPPGVALSSATGRFSATVSNGLDQPVEVSIQALTEDPSAISIQGPETVEVPAGGQASVLLDATTREPGVHNVTLVVTEHTDDPDDQHAVLGSSDRVPIRSIRASAVIWVIMGVGGLLLFGTIAVRLVRRLRAARREGLEA